MKFGIILPERS